MPDVGSITIPTDISAGVALLSAHIFSPVSKSWANTVNIWMNPMKF